MSSLPFAAYGVFEVREDDKPELLEHSSVCAAFQYTDMTERVTEMFNHLTLPEKPGFYTFWVVGTIQFGEYEAREGLEYYEDAEPDVVVIEPAKQGCMEYLKNQLPGLTWPFEEVTLEDGSPGAFLRVDPKDYQQHQHQHDINHLLATDPKYIKATKDTRYKPDQLRMMASAQIRGLKVDLKTGTISVPPT